MTRTQLAELRQRIKKRVDALPDNRLVVVDDFLGYLHDRVPNAATRELMRIPGLLNELQRAEREIKRGRLTSVRQLRRKK